MGPLAALFLVLSAGRHNEKCSKSENDNNYYEHMWKYNEIAQGDLVIGNSSCRYADDDSFEVCSI